jgi:sugar phosphate isomerase/epimerase
MLKLAAFADEISPDLDTQIEHCRKNGITHIELRSVMQVNVLDFDARMRREIKRKLDEKGVGVVSISSPVGKVKLSEPFDAHFERFKIAVDLAEFFAAPFVRIFSYYEATARDEVVRRMQRKVEYIRGRNVTLLHENEARIFGEKAVQCLDMLQTINSPRFRAVFDFANFVQASEDPLAAWAVLKPYTVHFHIKDALRGSGEVVLSGEGDGRIPEILCDAFASGYDGFLSLEPHLATAGQFAGFSGPELFAAAVNALKKIVRNNNLDR